MALKIEIIEPGGEDSVVVDLEQRVDKQQRVTVGRPRGKGFPHHIPFKKAIGMISAIQMTLEIRGEGETQELWVRDGGYRDEEWRASTNKTRLNADFIAPTQWHPLRVGDVLRIGSPQNFELSQFAIRYPTSETASGTISGSATTSFGAVEVWNAESILNDHKGVLLLRKVSNGPGLIVEKLDYLAEEILGGQPGDLINLAGRILLESFVNERDELLSHISLTEKQMTPVTGIYTGMTHQLNLVLDCKYIDNHKCFLGYVKPVIKPVAQPVAQPVDEPEDRNWKDELAHTFGQLAKDKPVLFVVGLIVFLGLSLVLYLLVN